VNPSGVFLVLLGVWIGCQVLGGQALERLNVVGGSGGGSG
jgi:hypothetical protein